MTRDTQGLLDDRDGNDVEVYAALWAATPFPRLPNDAPSEMRKLTVDINDPKRVYAVHKASRRYQFQMLVERYIMQVRYGCQNSLCTTTTCFSCRKRLAGGAPVRRYNATSARTLAVYMASQDNPEQGLCQNPSAEQPVPNVNKVSPSASKLNVMKATIGKQPGNADGHALDATTPSGVSTSKGNAKSRKKAGHKADRQMPVNILDEVTKTDHRSFVQNVFGTVAFKMLEWLTPRSLDILATEEKEEEKLSSSVECHSPSTGGDSTPNSQSAQKGDVNERNVSIANGANATKEETISSDFQSKSRRPQEALDPKPPAITEGNATNKVEPISVPTRDTLATRSPSPNLRRKSEHLESQLSKGPLNVSTSPKKTNSMSEMKPLSRDLLNGLPTRRLSQPSAKPGAIPKSKIQLSKTVSVAHDGISSNLKESASPRPRASSTSEIRETAAAPIDPVAKCTNKMESSLRIQKNTASRAKTQHSALPQSLSKLTIEIIDLICDILQADNTFEKHVLQPEMIEGSLKRSRQTGRPDRLFRNRSHGSILPSSAKQEWHMFIEQTIFDVLSKPESLLLSFSGDQKSLFDTQTIWYLMLRLTRVAPSLVFHGLWMAAGTLFQPPEKIDTMYEWAKESPPQTPVGQKNLSNIDAAKVMNICLHALVAAAPLLSDPGQLANMSRTRSYGMTMLGRDMATKEPAHLCLQYDDAFSNDIALRLARRIFAAIPTRRRFSELLELQQEARSEETREQDILDAVLSTLKFLDPASPPILNFSTDERNLHEKRVPTLILDWARTIMLQDWEGHAVVPGDGAFAGALAMMAAIHKNRKSLLLGDIHFRTEYFAERLDPVEMPIEWLNFESNRRTVHILDHPYLFNPSTLVTYFRAINYSRMNQAFETAKAAYGLMRHTVQENSLMTDDDRRYRLFGQLSTATAKFMVLEIRRDHVLRDTFDSIWRREERELMRPLKIRLGEEGGEEGLDSGGVQHEFFRLAIAEALNPDYGTFTIDPTTKMTWFQPGSPEPLWKFELIGMIISLAVYNGLTLPVTFPKALYRKLLDEDVSELHHIADGWPDLAKGLTALLEWDESDGLVEDIFARTYEFSVEQFGQHVSREMGTSTQWPQFNELHTSANPPDAPLVTNENRNNYVSDYIHWLTDVSIRPQFEALKSGFFACVDRRSITLFDADTLQSLVEGIQEIDISDLRRATRYIGWEGGSLHRTVRDFWSIVKRYDLEQKKKLLEFVTASDRVPVGGMQNLQFTLQKNGVDDAHLPSSYTCYGVMLVPEYSSREVLREKLAMALENSKGFGFA